MGRGNGTMDQGLGNPGKSTCIKAVMFARDMQTIELPIK